MTGTPGVEADDHRGAVWARAWLQSVADGGSTMSQRSLSSVARHGADLATIRDVARELGVHVLRCFDDQGKELLAASKHPFEVIA